MSADELRAAIVSQYARTAIRAKAARLSRQPGFQRGDRDDLEQKLVLHLLSQVHQYQPERSSLNTFIDRVLDSAVRMELRQVHRLKRGRGRQPDSLDVETAHGPVREGLPQDVHFRRTGTTSPDPCAARLEQHALQAAVSALPDDLRPLGERLMVIGRTQLAAELGISARQLGHQLARIRTYLERAGFGPEPKSRREPEQTA